MKIIKLTPHAINFEGNGIVTSFPPSGDVARVAVTQHRINSPVYLGGVFPLFVRTTGEVENLPKWEEGKIYIVSGMVREALGKTRPDVIAPDSGATAIRDSQGRITSVTQFIGVL